MKNCKEESNDANFIGEPKYQLGKVAWEGSQKGDYTAIKCHNTPCDNGAGSYEINLPYYVGGTPEELLVLQDKILKAQDDQSISTGPLRYTFTERLLIDDTKATCNQTF